MNIAQAKQQIKDTIEIYLKKYDDGKYCIPINNQRPIFIQGAPGLGKTAIMEQISKEMGIGFVTYSMTHHTRQSAVGLPMIVQREYAGQEFSVSEYTMSEIIASVYECMKNTGCSEGILFLDEINCISETLLPSMLLFLQYKIFGGHRLPDGWIVVTAGNQSQYNKNAREFDVAIQDRLQFIMVEPDISAWMQYAKAKAVSSSIVSYLEIKPDNFYRVGKAEARATVVTPRGWEDLSVQIKMREQYSMPVDYNLMSQYLQDEEIARDFSNYYELFQKYRATFHIEEILSNTYEEETLTKAKAAKMEESFSLIELLVETISLEMAECMRAFNILKERKAKLESEEEKTEYKIDLNQLKINVKKTQERIGNLLDFVKKAYGEGNQLCMVINDLATISESATFIGQFVCQEYYKASSELSLAKQEEDILKVIELELG